jgi:hypothetical protein
MSKCDWKSDGDLTNDYGDPRVIGDVLYNCSPTQNAEAAIEVTDKRGESTSVSESVSLEVSLGFLDLEKQSLEFDAFSKQSQTFSTEVKIIQAVAVPPGYKGWTEATMLSGNVTGSAYITQGIHLIQVKDIDLQFPGYKGPGTSGEQPVVYSGTASPMTADEIESRCHTVGADPGSWAEAARAAQARRPAPRERFKITVCRRKRAAAQRRGPRCVRPTVTGLKKPPRLRKVTARLYRAGRVYAAENDRRGGVRQTQRRNITPGRYRLVFEEKRRKLIVRHNGRLLHRAEQRMVTIVPLEIRWSRRK